MVENHGICYIVGAMPLEPELLPQPQPGDLLIAADGGYASLYTRGIPVDLVVGDFDSLNTVPQHPNVIRLPRIKDETDMGFAINHGLELGYTRFVLLGGIGGRLEHTVANLQQLHYLSVRGARGILAGSGQAAVSITNGTMDFPPEMSGYCSVFCQSGTAQGVTLEGLKYPLEDDQLISAFPLGVSNEFLGLPARITVKEGSLLVIWNCHGHLMDQLPILLK